MLNSKSQIEIIDDSFQIIRNEGCGYVNNLCVFDENIFLLNKTNSATELEGGKCIVSYKFTIVEKITSVIVFVIDYIDKKRYDYYKYDCINNTIKECNANSIIHKTVNGELVIEIRVPTNVSFENKTTYCEKCVIS